MNRIPLLSTLLRTAWLVAFFATVSTTAYAQQIKIVQGRVIDKESKKPFKDEVVDVYAFNTVADAKDAIEVIESGRGNVMADAMTVTDMGGNYEIKVAETGALIFKVAMATAVLEEVQSRMTINVSLDAGQMIENITISGKLSDIAPITTDPEIIGNTMSMYNTFPIPEKFGKKNARLIIQPYLMNCRTEDTVGFMKPIILDGPEYRMTQERRMNYDLNNDPLEKLVSGTRLSDQRMDIPWNASVRIPDPKQNYSCFAVFRLEDYNTIYYEKQNKISSCNARRPLKFLEYHLDQYEMDPTLYMRRAKRELRNTATSLSLTFLLGRAELDNENPENERLLNQLREDLMLIVNGEDSKLKEIKVTGVSSPDGSYQTNKELAQRRAVFAINEIKRMLPASVVSHTFIPAPDSYVAGWTDLIPLLERDSLFAEAEEIRRITEEIPDNDDAQERKIAQLPYYDTVIKDHLNALRYMKVEYKHEVNRELTRDEVMDRYLHDADYRSGKKEFELYEYGYLFDMVKDPKEREVIFRRAYKRSEDLEGRPWELAANHLAVSYLQRDTFDLNILTPFINRKFAKVNLKQPNGSVINPEEIVANQLMMYLLADNFEDASVMAKILPDTPKNEKTKAFAMCLGGYYKGGKDTEDRARRRNVFNLVSESSPINRVVMNLAMNLPSYDAEAKKGLAELPADDPKTWYLKAIAYRREGEASLEMAKVCLEKAFALDTSKEKDYQVMASMDGDIGEELYEYVMDMYEMDVDMLDIYIQQYKL